MNQIIKQPETGLGSTAETNRLLGKNAFDTTTGAPIGAVPSTIGSSNLAPATPINLPTPKVDTTSVGVTGATPAIVQQQKVDAQIAADTAAKQASVDTQKSGISSLIGQITGLQTTRSSAEGDITTPGTPAYLKEVARKAANALDISSKAQLNELAAVDGQGLTDVQKNQAKAEINRKYASAQADQQLTYHLANSDYTSAEDTLNTKFQLDLAPLQTQLTYQQKVYDDIKGDLSTAENRQWTSLINESSKALETETANKKAVSDIFSKLQENNPQALKNNPQLGVQLANAKDGVEASQILARNGISLANQTDEAYKKAQTASLYSKISPTGAATIYTVPASEVPGGLYQISQDNGIDFEALKAANPQLGADYKITPGTTLNIPGSGVKNYSTIDISRYGRAANSIVKNYIALPQYSLVANAFPYLQRIQAADTNPGSVSDADLLDSLVKVNTGGGQVTEAQVKLITDGKSYADSVNVWKNKLGNGGVLSDSQRAQLTNLATAVFDKYKTGYQPVYDQVTKQLKDAQIPEAFWTIPDLNKLDAQDTTAPVTTKSGSAFDQVAAIKAGYTTDEIKTYLNTH